MSVSVPQRAPGALRPRLLAAFVALPLACAPLLASGGEEGGGPGYRPVEGGEGHRHPEGHGHGHGGYEPGDHEGELAAWMGRLQYYVHKLGLAVAARNRPLQGYYVHEVEEIVEEIEKIRELDGIAVGELVRLKLVPPFEDLESAVEVGDQARVDAAYDALLAGCNRCHMAANRPYIHILRRTDNPYMQDFAPVP